MRYEKYTAESSSRVAASYGTSGFSIVLAPVTATIASIDFFAAAIRPSSVFWNAAESGLEAQSGGGKPGGVAAGAAHKSPDEPARSRSAQMLNRIFDDMDSPSCRPFRPRGF